jgi:hypothetical protein
MKMFLEEQAITHKDETKNKDTKIIEIGLKRCYFHRFLDDINISNSDTEPMENIYRKIRKNDEKKDIYIPIKGFSALIKNINQNGNYDIPYINQQVIFRPENNDKREHQTRIDQNIDGN